MVLPFTVLAAEDGATVSVFFVRSRIREQGSTQSIHWIEAEVDLGGKQLCL